MPKKIAHNLSLAVVILAMIHFLLIYCSIIQYNKTVYFVSHFEIENDVKKPVQ